MLYLYIYYLGVVQFLLGCSSRITATVKLS